MSQCRPLWLQLVWDSLSFLDLYDFFLHQIRNRLSIPCLLSPPSGIPMMKMLLCFMLSKMFLKIFPFFLIVFFSQLCLRIFFLPCRLNHLFDPLLHLTYCLFFPVYYLFQMLHSLFMTGPFYGFSVFFMLLSIFISIPLNPLSDKLLASFSSSFPLGELSFIWRSVSLSSNFVSALYFFSMC